jgi:hypothetical protein
LVQVVLVEHHLMRLILVLMVAAHLLSVAHLLRFNLPALCLLVVVVLVVIYQLVLLDKMEVLAVVV